MKISKIAQSIAESTTLKLNETFGILKSQGEPVIHLGGGEPHGKAPLSALEKSLPLLEKRIVRYSPSAGTKELREAVASYTEKYYDKKPEIKNIIISSGAKQALMVALQTIVDFGEEVLFPAPFWVSYPEMVKLAGGIPVPVPLKNKNLQPEISDFEKKITSKTRAILLNSPNNPSGVLYNREFIKEIIQYTKEKGIYLLMDDIYHRLLFDNKKHTPVLDFIEDIEQSHIIIFNGISKTYAMTGFRIGWAIAPSPIIKIMTNIQSHQTGGPSPLLQKAALGAITGPQDDVETLRNTLNTHRDKMLKAISPLSKLHITKPDGTFYMFIDFSEYEPNSMKLAALLLEKVKVLTMPGKPFGVEGYLRLSYCGAENDIIEGIDRIVWALSAPKGSKKQIRNQTVEKDW